MGDLQDLFDDLAHWGPSQLILTPIYDGEIGARWEIVGWKIDLLTRDWHTAHGDTLMEALCFLLQGLEKKD